MMKRGMRNNVVRTTKIPRMILNFFGENGRWRETLIQTPATMRVAIELGIGQPNENKISFRKRAPGWNHVGNDRQSTPRQMADTTPSKKTAEWIHVMRLPFFGGILVNRKIAKIADKKFATANSTYAGYTPLESTKLIGSYGGSYAR
jgi:hypothetical protein